MTTPVNPKPIPSGPVGPTHPHGPAGPRPSQPAKAAPMSTERRTAIYERRNAGRPLTARQRRRLRHKTNALLGVA